MKLLKILIFGLMIILISRFVYSQGWYQITITNAQSQATPAPFQQDIATVSYTHLTLPTIYSV